MVAPPHARAATSRSSSRPAPRETPLRAAKRTAPRATGEWEVQVGFETLPSIGGRATSDGIETEPARARTSGQGGAAAAAGSSGHEPPVRPTTRPRWPGMAVAARDDG